ncbi:MAG TPA: lysophospholipid acyltransferase family protein [Bryobacteraceae bacterium]|nr:lysophospholipid acyltransferase family protein [Bryobacteraceae bacterium]
MRPRPAIRNALEYIAALVVIKSLEWAPLGPAYWLARRYAALLDVGLPRLRRAAQRNLELALPEVARDRRHAIIDGVFESVARLLVSVAKIPSIRPGNLASWIRTEGWEHVAEAQRAGRGILFATAHLGNWELSAYAYALLAQPMYVVVRPLDNPLIDALIERRRALSGNHIILKKDFARAILKALAGNEAVGVLVDQNTSSEAGIFVDFFGIPASAGTGFTKLAAHSGAAVIPGFALWSREERRYVLRFYPAVPMTGDPARDTQSLHARLEAVIREYPDQWLWIHRRWKTRPPGQPSLYESTPAVTKTL